MRSGLCAEVGQEHARSENIPRLARSLPVLGMRCERAAGPQSGRNDQETRFVTQQRWRRTGVARGAASNDAGEGWVLQSQCERTSLGVTRLLVGVL